jgi:hypothetical protein
MSTTLHVSLEEYLDSYRIDNPNCGNAKREIIVDSDLHAVPAVLGRKHFDTQAWIASPSEARLIEDGILRCTNPNLEIALSDILPEE